MLFPAFAGQQPVRIGQLEYIGMKGRATISSPTNTGRTRAVGRNRLQWTRGGFGQRLLFFGRSGLEIGGGGGGGGGGIQAAEGIEPSGGHANVEVEQLVRGERGAGGRDRCI